VIFELKLDETVGHIDLVAPLTVEPSVSVRSVLDQMRDTKRGSVSVCEDGKLVGIFTERDALNFIAAEADFDVAIEKVMTRNPETVSSDDQMLTAINKMSIGGYRRLPVVDADGKPTGLLKVSTILHYLVQHFPAFVYNLPPTPKQRSAEREGA